MTRQAAVRFVGAYDYTSAFLKLRDVVLNEVPSFVGFVVIVALNFAVHFGPNHSDRAARITVLEQPISVEGLVRQ